MVADFFGRAIKAYGPQGGVPKVLDFGCGMGDLVNGLGRLGFDAYGCDLDASWRTDDTWSRSGPATEWRNAERLFPIGRVPYRLPFEDAAFDVVVSDQVLEHAQNVDEAFAEIRRVLKPGGVALHVMPSKWHLPLEPHFFVPFASWMWPNIPRWWLALWAILGIRSKFQKGMHWKEVVALNEGYSRNGIIYLPKSKITSISNNYFAETLWPARFYAANADSRLARAVNGLPGGSLPAELLATFRQRFLVQRKAA